MIASAPCGSPTPTGAGHLFATCCTAGGAIRPDGTGSAILYPASPQARMTTGGILAFDGDTS